MKQLAYFLPTMINWQCEHWQLPLMVSAFPRIDKLAREVHLNAGLNLLASAITKDGDSSIRKKKPLA
ncbi:hypothetical protein J2Y88_001996 [Pseudomonas chlororaphis]|uniref:hypothetical protein n=1 Tax=Pseudomonas chlororaphis TaxID=587753 RepID=UPI00209D0B74|nr:hypothetical protein [Pseudomonas chlororaphis]MCP1479685.1 hypothetical protein [Pseudomonas chlororaphis]MCP1593963.1 hypothetical protein [Pseudomonas chlororaphis]